MSPNQGNSAIVEPDRLVFPLKGNEGLLKKKVGDILVSGEGEGFLRRVAGYYKTGDQIVVLTEEAALSDAIIEGSLKAEIKPFEPHESTDDAGLSLGRGTLKQAITEDLSIGLSIDNVSFYTEQPGLDARITRGHIRFDPRLDLELSFKDGQLERFEFVVIGELDFEMVAQVVAEGTFGVLVPITLAETPPMKFSFMIGFVPVVVFVTVGVVATVDTWATNTKSSLEVGVAASSTIWGGARFENGAWSPVADHGLEFRPIGPNVRTEAGSTRTKVSLRTHVTVKFYNLAGPRLFVRPHLDLTQEAPSSEKSCTFTAGLDGGVAMIATALVSPTTPFLYWEKVLYDAPPIDLGERFGVCRPSTDCTYGGDAAFCRTQEASCDPLTASDNCGQTRTVNCGSCELPMTCGGSGVANVCGEPMTCTYEGDATFCRGQGANCDPVTASDNCGQTRTVNCGPCTLPMTCGGSGVTNVCGETSGPCPGALSDRILAVHDSESLSADGSKLVYTLVDIDLQNPVLIMTYQVNDDPPYDNWLWQGESETTSNGFEVTAIRVDPVERKARVCTRR